MLVIAKNNWFFFVVFLNNNQLSVLPKADGLSLLATWNQHASLSFLKSNTPAANAALEPFLCDLQAVLAQEADISLF